MVRSQESEFRMIFAGRDRIRIFLTQRHEDTKFIISARFFDAYPAFVSFVTLCDVLLRLTRAFPDDVIRRFARSVLAGRLGRAVIILLVGAKAVEDESGVSLPVDERFPGEGINRNIFNEFRRQLVQRIRVGPVFLLEQF